ncbi:MAG: hypothetical protein HY320_03250 [Armatimonadetes bacterium]|nr:hypothetical protein [Armatimonadota bacterium]
MSAHTRSTATTTPSTSDEDRLREDLARLRAMLEQGDIEGARAFIKELEARWPDSEAVRHFARVLAPPKVIRSDAPAGRSYARERAWLREHAREYPGCWLAVHGDRLITADPSLKVVLGKVREIPGAEDALLHYNARWPIKD